MEITFAKRDLIGAGLLLCVGLGTVYFGIKYDIGTPQSMGPGFFPMVLGAILAGLSVLIAISSLGSSNTETVKLPSAAPFLVLISLVAFALLLFSAGLVIAIIASVFISSLSTGEFRPFRSLLLGVILAVCSVLVFRVALGQPLPLFVSWM